MIKHHKTSKNSIATNTEQMENIVCAGFPSIVQCLLELSLEEIGRVLLSEVWHKSFPQIFHVLETRDFRQTSVHHHEKQRDEKVTVSA